MGFSVEVEVLPVLSQAKLLVQVISRLTCQFLTDKLEKVAIGDGQKVLQCRIDAN
jgi:hypothetical protein